MASAAGLELAKNGSLSQQDHQLYADLFAAIPPNINRLGSSVGDELPDVEREIVIKERLESSAVYLGALAAGAAFSKVTGCWSVLKGRDNKGYVRLFSKNYQIAPNDGHNYGIGSHRLAYVLKLQEQGFEPTIPADNDVDHICRNTACCNPDHLRLADKIENNRLKNKAERFERALAIGQLIMGKIGIDWFDETLEESDDSDTGLVVSTRFGPHRIIKEDDRPLLFYGLREPCELYDSLQPPSKRIEKRKSRAKRPKILTGQQVFV